MKDKFGFVKKMWGYNIIFISDQRVHFSMHILVGKVIQNWKASEVLVGVVALDA